MDGTVFYIGEHDKGILRVLNDIARRSYDTKRASLNAYDIVQEIYRLQESGYRLTGAGFGRGSPKLPITPFHRLDIFMETENSERDTNWLAQYIVRGAMNKYVRFNARATYLDDSDDPVYQFYPLEGASKVTDDDLGRPLGFSTRNAAVAPSRPTRKRSTRTTVQRKSFKRKNSTKASRKSKKKPTPVLPSDEQAAASASASASSSQPIDIDEEPLRRTRVPPPPVFPSRFSAEDWRRFAEMAQMLSGAQMLSNGIV